MAQYFLKKTLVFSLIALFCMQTLLSAETRQYMLGDIDNLHYDGAGSVDDVYVDPDYWSKLEAEIHPPTHFDLQEENHHVPGTFLFPLQPGEIIISAEVTLGLKGVDSLVSSDGLGFEASDGFFAGGYFTDWGWEPIPTTEVVTRTADLSNVIGENLIPHIQDGFLNFSTNDDTAIDYAILTIEVVPEPTTAAIFILGGIPLLKKKGKKNKLLLKK